MNCDITAYDYRSLRNHDQFADVIDRSASKQQQY